jgi:quercetin dioxygenase-like cupin family protein
MTSEVARRGILGLGLAAAAAGPARAQQARPLPTAPPLPRVPAGVVHIPRKDAQTLAMAEWEVVQEGRGEQTGARVLIAEGDEAVGKAPAGASRYEARTYKFPSGAVRVLSWKRGDGPVIHQITFETEIYMLEGAAEVDVAGVPTKIAAGDAVFMPGGVLRNLKPTSDTVVVQFFVSATTSAPKASVVRGDALKESWTVQWREGDKPMTARTPEEIAKAPPGAARYAVKRYVFDGNSIRLADLKKGGITNTVKTGASDALFYVTKGRLRRTEGDEVFEAVAGDALRELAGVAGHWELLEDSAFIATDAPFDPSVNRANP